MGGTTVEFWYEFAGPIPISPRHDRGLVAATSIRLDWRPFLLGPILAQRAQDPNPTPAQRRFRWAMYSTWVRLKARFGFEHFIPARVKALVPVLFG